MSRLLSILAVLTVAMANAAAQQVADTISQEPLPRLTTVADLFNSTERPAEPWTGFDPACYKDMSFYKKDGIAHLRGRIIGYTPECDVKTIIVRIQNAIKDSWKISHGEINPDGTFSVNIPQPYPHYDRVSLGNIHKDIFLIPGDTLSIVTTMEEVRRGNEYELQYFGYEGEINDAAAVNILADSVCRHFGLDELRDRPVIENTDSMKALTYAANEEIASLLDTIIADLPRLLGNLPVSGFAKDILSNIAIGDAAEVMEKLRKDFLIAKNPKRPIRRTIGKSIDNEGEDPYEKLDDVTFLAPHKKHLDLLYDNPLLICEGYNLLNVWSMTGIFTNLMFDVNLAWIGYEYNADLGGLDSLGIGDCFAARLVPATLTMSRMKRPNIPDSDLQEKRAAWITALLKRSDYDVINQELMASYDQYLKQVALLENQPDMKETVDIDPAAYGGVLERIIAPYRGNVLFLDFWDSGCGPCRKGMIKQKSMLHEYADQPFKALYIAPDRDIDDCKEWLQKENIQGEHIFITQNDWNRLQSLFNFLHIPFGAIIDSNGKVIHTDCRMPAQKGLLDKLLLGK